MSILVSRQPLKKVVLSLELLLCLVLLIEVMASKYYVCDCILGLGCCGE